MVMSWPPVTPARRARATSPCLKSGCRHLRRAEALALRRSVQQHFQEVAASAWVRLHELARARRWVGLRALHIHGLVFIESRHAVFPSRLVVAPGFPGRLILTKINRGMLIPQGIYPARRPVPP